MSAVVLRGLSKSYGPVQALRGIDLAVETGEFTVLLGPSGCGKSTLLSAIAGLDDIDAGSVEIGGVDVTGREPSERGIAMVFQSYALYPTMTVRRRNTGGRQSWSPVCGRLIPVRMAALCSSPTASSTASSRLPTLLPRNA